MHFKKYRTQVRNNLKKNNLSRCDEVCRIIFGVLHETCFLPILLLEILNLTEFTRLAKK